MNSQTEHTDNNSIIKELFSTTFENDFEKIQHIVSSMELLMKQSENQQIEKKKSAYVYARASMHTKHRLLNMNYHYGRANIRPPKNLVINLGTPNNKPLPPKTAYSQYIKKDKESLGKEDSVKNHTYNDYAPLVASVDDFKPLYNPQTIQYIWSGNPLEYDVAVKLKADLQHFLTLTDTERANYMADITTIRTIDTDDLKNDACDKELLGHRGVFARKKIPKMSAIGIYAGVFIKDALDMLKLSQKMPLKDFQDYLFRIPLQDKFPKISGYQHGNRLSIINAASNYQEGDTVTFQQICHRANLMLVAAKTGECPIVHIAQNENCPDILFFIAGKDIEEGEQLLYDYGNVYW